MITWNYRVFREDNNDYVIREVFYDEAGAIVGCTEHAIEPFGSSLEELARSIDDMKVALTLPVLTLNEIPTQTRRQTSTQSEQRLALEAVRAALGLDSDTSAAISNDANAKHKRAS
jgi:hypothetical protein